VVVLVGGGVIHIRSVVPPPSAPIVLFYGALGGAFLLSLTIAALIRAQPGRAQGLLADLQLLSDMVITTLLIYATGGQDSVLTFLYPLNTLYAAALVSRPTGYTMAAAGAASFAALVGLGVVGVIPRLDEPGVPFDREAVSVVTATAGANFLVAMLGGQLSEQLRTSAQTLRQTKLDLRELQSLNTAMVDSLFSGLISLDSRGVVQLINPAALGLLGVDSAAILSQPLRSILPGVDVGHRPPGDTTEVVYQHPDGKPRILTVVISPLHGGGGSHAGAVVSFQDVTNQRQLEQAMALSRRLATVGQFAAGLAHELRNPLGSMIGCVELLQQGARHTGDPDQERLLSIIQREAQRLARLVQDFLLYARPQPPQPVRVDVMEFLQEVAFDWSRDPLAATAPVEVLGKPGPVLQADTSQLRQVLWNLLRNAAQVSTSNAPITLRAEETSLAGRPAVSIWVEDQGPGVPEPVARRLFEPFFTTNPQGTGLGLATVHRIVEAHGGTVGLRSSGGPGAAFHVTLPKEGPSPSPVETTLAEDSPHGANPGGG
jgi:two-component system sensor histidine kinase PilS (NtrC family)